MRFPRIVAAEYVPAKPGDPPPRRAPVLFGKAGYIVPPARLTPSRGEPRRYILRLTVVPFRPWDRALAWALTVYALWKVRP